MSWVKVIFHLITPNTLQGGYYFLHVTDEKLNSDSYPRLYLASWQNEEFSWCLASSKLLASVDLLLPTPSDNWYSDCSLSQIIFNQVPLILIAIKGEETISLKIPVIQVLPARWNCQIPSKKATSDSTWMFHSRKNDCPQPASLGMRSICLDVDTSTIFFCIKLHVHLSL